jgi:hypothetical protein
MLLEGWEALMWFDEVRGRAQTLYEHVLVDEFQDISPVQYLMLDVLTEPHHDDARRNYMAIGDRPVHLRVAGGRPVASLGLPGGVQWRRIRSIPGATNRACECRYCKRKTPTGEAY